MHQYRVTKYDPHYRVNGAYTRDEWTSFSDVGESFGGVPFTLADYEEAEARHIAFLCALVEQEVAYPLTIDSLESDPVACPWSSRQTIGPQELPVLLRDVLRGRCWCRLMGRSFFIHFGYDYYMYVGCSFTSEGITALAGRFGLFAEPLQSPCLTGREASGLPSDLRPMTAIYLTRGDEMLLLYRIGSRVVGNSYTGAAGGHMEPEEIDCAKACVLRELEEETGLTPDALEGLAMRYVTLRLKDGEIRQNYYFFAALREGFAPSESTEGQLRWFRLDELDALPMPVTAKHIVRHYVSTGRHTSLLYGCITTADGPIFAPMEEF